jgi:hypothetical protein
MQHARSETASTAILCPAVDQMRHTSSETASEASYVNQMRHTSSETVCVNDVDVRIKPGEQLNEQTDENDAADRRE